MSTPTYAGPPRSGHLQAIWVFTILAAVGSIALRLVLGAVLDDDNLEESIKMRSGSRRGRTC